MMGRCTDSAYIIDADDGISPEIVFNLEFVPEKFEVEHYFGPGVGGGGMLKFLVDRRIRETHSSDFT